MTACTLLCGQNAQSHPQQNLAAVSVGDVALLRFLIGSLVNEFPAFTTEASVVVSSITCSTQHTATKLARSAYGYAAGVLGKAAQI